MQTTRTLGTLLLSAAFASGAIALPETPTAPKNDASSGVSSSPHAPFVSHSLREFNLQPCQASFQSEARELSFSQLACETDVKAHTGVNSTASIKTPEMSAPQPPQDVRHENSEKRAAIMLGGLITFLFAGLGTAAYLERGNSSRGGWGRDSSSTAAGVSAVTSTLG